VSLQTLPPSNLTYLLPPCHMVSLNLISLLLVFDNVVLLDGLIRFNNFSWMRQLECFYHHSVLIFNQGLRSTYPCDGVGLQL
jgi:hypothetical protein